MSLLLKRIYIQKLLSLSFLFGFIIIILDCSIPHHMILKNKSLFSGKVRIAFFPFKDSPSFPGSGKIVSEALTRSSLKMKEWQTIERKIIRKILEEKKINLASGLGLDDLKEINRFLGADYFITGTVTQYSISETVLEFNFQLSFQYRIVSIKDGTVKLVGNFRTFHKDEKRKGTSAALRLKETDYKKQCVALIIGITFDIFHYFIADSDTYKDEMDYLNIAGNKWVNDLGSKLEIPVLDD